ncbi:ABC transporter ATP-binding protein [Humisphaera borealis]|uniref:ATP-binding cassette domain-containing protein n=1 Tax=Humisphaera borealis TaxID=2807512 RepID=A0A7M2WZD0_9BACT|nr:ATP-binding cassette domain-containing protein [Humisphaera borealis]QOV90825.1 ATP-binding cassette domain-containing protein [Humisphaera borealis]
MAAVELSHITKTYSGGVTAVDDLSLSIEDHQFVVLVGPSGCGKSTTLRLIAGLEEADTGRISIGGRDVTDIAPKDRDIAMVFQNYALYPHMTVYGNLSFGLRLRKMPSLLKRLRHPSQARQIGRDIDERVKRVADLLDIRSLLNRKPRELSGGQRQRVAVGRAIVREPAAFLFDEPLSNLDARLRLTTRAELKRLHQKLRTTTVYVTHDQEEAMTLGDRIIVMLNGKVQQDGPPLELYHRPRNRFVAGFIGMPPMNFIEGHLEATENSPKLSFVESAPSGRKSVGGTGDGLTYPTKGFTLILSRDAAPSGGVPSSWVGRKVIMGIRPEHLSLRPFRADDGSVVSQPLQMRLTLIEPIGSSIDLYLQSAGNDQIVARVDAANGLVSSGPSSPGETSGLTPQLGSLVTVHVDVRRIHLFEPEDTGMNLSLETTPSGQPTTELAHAMA